MLHPNSLSLAFPEARRVRTRNFTVLGKGNALKKITCMKKISPTLVVLRRKEGCLAQHLAHCCQ